VRADGILVERRGYSAPFFFESAMCCPVFFHERQVYFNPGFRLEYEMPHNQTLVEDIVTQKC
jgi:hypothetical protein